MRRRLVLLMALAIAASVALAVARGVASGAPSGPTVARSSLPPRLASYLGVYERGPPHTYQPVIDFAKTAGRHPNLVGYYSGWGEPFARSFAETVRRHGAVTILQMDPTYASIPAIAAGSYDRYLRSFADSVRSFGHPVVIGFGHEMNADWYSVGIRPCPGADVRGGVAAHRVAVPPPGRWQRHLAVDDQPGPFQHRPDRLMVAGGAYVTWVGIDGYYYRPSSTFATVFGQTIAQVRALTSKPLLLSETAVGPQAGQPTKIQGLFDGMREYQTLGLVWFDIAQHQGIYHQDWRIEDSQSAAAAFRRGASSLTLARP